MKTTLIHAERFQKNPRRDQRNVSQALDLAKRIIPYSYLRQQPQQEHTAMILRGPQTLPHAIPIAWHLPHKCHLGLSRTTSGLSPRSAPGEVSLRLKVKLGACPDHASSHHVTHSKGKREREQETHAMTLFIISEAALTKDKSDLMREDSFSLSLCCSLRRKLKSKREPPPPPSPPPSLPYLLLQNSMWRQSEGHKSIWVEGLNLKDIIKDNIPHFVLGGLSPAVGLIDNLTLSTSLFHRK